MTNRAVARNLVYAIALLAAPSGCEALHRYRPAPVLVRDADTGKPIPGAEVRLSYLRVENCLAPHDSTATTAADGIARLRAVAYNELGVRVSATARGYLDQDKNVEESAVEAIEPASPFEKVEGRPPCIVVEMYAGPHPTLELVVPAGFRGPIQAELQVREDAPRTPGQRCFSCVVSPTGVAQVVGPPLLRRVYAPDFRGRSADGAVLSRDAQGSEMGLWWLRNDGNVHHLFVGTRSEFDSERRTDAREGEGATRSSGGRRGGGRRGGRGRGGNSTPASAGTGEGL
jgi:hypothetical protein